MTRVEAPALAVTRALMITSMAALIIILIARVVGPVDTYDQTQPKTVSYTTDIVANGRWILPLERAELPATKPPLYNWIAAPIVAIVGFASDIAHKMPSVMGLCVSWLVLVRLGRSLDSRSGEAIGWITGLAFVCNYAMCKLGYLARPDMLLTLWLILAWISATKVMIDRDGERPGSRFGWLALFWGSTALAGLTKGPVLFVPIVYALLAGKLLRGSWREAKRFQWWWGIPVAILPFGVWLLSVHLIDPSHFQTLWHDEFWGRITGAGPEGNSEGLSGWLRTVAHMPIYFLARFVPWCVLTLLAIVVFARKRREIDPPMFLWLRGAIGLIVIMLVLFTISTGKRADYIAAAYAPGALLAAWVLVKRPRFSHRTVAAVIIVTTAVTLMGLIIDNEMESVAPTPGFGTQITRFARDATRIMNEEPHPTIYWNHGGTHLQAYLGHSKPFSSASAREAINDLKPGGTIWAVAGYLVEDEAGGRVTRRITFPDWADRQFRDLRIEEIVRSPDLPRVRYWPGQVWLYRVTRAAE